MVPPLDVPPRVRSALVKPVTGSLNVTVYRIGSVFAGSAWPAFWFTVVVVLTRRRNGEELVAAVRAGAAGYLGEDVSQARLPAIMRGILDGEVALPRRETQHLLDAIRGRDARQAAIAARAATALTARELEVLDLVVAQVPTGEMARRLGVSQVTVRRHVSSVLGKLSLPSRAAAVELLGERSAE
jgi:DNA-binding NarL/FixJ family response regulator